ncbi:hypothetical protein MU852_15370 [Brevundimonas albigilva]|nr:hypothetical protein [Brevundimonas albigilva]UQV18111.1 hypothetical protein MU852_15370 [Brevundimonas albigilva]
MSESDIVILLLLSVLRQLQTIEVRIGNAHQLGLTTLPRTHLGKAIRCAGGSRVGREAETRQTAFAIFAETATDVERHAHAIALLDAIYGSADFDDLAKVFVTENFALLKAGAALIHVKVRPADIGRGQPDDNIGLLFDLGIIDGIDGNIFGPVVHDSFHGSFPFAALLNASSNRELGNDPVHRNGGGHRTLRSDLSFLNHLLPERFLPVEPSRDRFTAVF